MTAPLGKIIESIRLAKGLSQSDLARALQVSPQAVQKWEAGGMPRPSRLADIAAALGVSVTFLSGCNFQLNLFTTGYCNLSNLVVTCSCSQLQHKTSGDEHGHSSRHPGAP